MKKLFEIPVYALSPSKLNIRASKRISELKKLFSRSNPDEATVVIDHETLPMRSWDYNHIIGYIRIAVSKTDILFEVFMPIPIPKKYVWYTSRKIYVQNICASGTHIYWGSLKTNEEFHDAVSNMLDQVITDHIPERFHVDREAFDATNKHLDYLTIVQDA
ncbi:MAG: hypothetical protein ACI4PT_02710 [Candidatus Avoscillospira sp.]